MPDGWSEERKQRVEESVRRTAEEMCRRLDLLYGHRSVEEAQILWFDKEVTRPCYWECITIKVDKYRSEELLGLKTSTEMAKVTQRQVVGTDGLGPRWSTGHYKGMRTSPTTVTCGDSWCNGSFRSSHS